MTCFHATNRWQIACNTSAGQHQRDGREGTTAPIVADCPTRHNLTPTTGWLLNPPPGQTRSYRVLASEEMSYTTERNLKCVVKRGSEGIPHPGNGVVRPGVTSRAERHAPLTRGLTGQISCTTRLSPRRTVFEPRRGRLGPSHVGIVMYDAVGQRVFSGISRLPLPFQCGAAQHSSRFTLIGSQDLVVKSRPDIFTHSPHSLDLARQITRSPLEGKGGISNTSPCTRHLNEEAREAEDPKKNPPTSGIVRHDSHLHFAIHIKQQVDGRLKTIFPTSKSVYCSPTMSQARVYHSLLLFGVGIKRMALQDITSNFTQNADKAMGSDASSLHHARA
ncbi:hypothetical protein PR048_002417 [Dryococelus australis]|uniref:Uncharacterized protein n=1 Tax=Dryococelus australis TaxID=614101 RepID=A0ABQ9IKA3_9NEOP|nr:hypothetical protein PR048_002417 [Dryococelus australis]